nr:uncharacterized protein LOC120966093 isoform X1 [Aegilops tauschii subsp. strangulata]
MVGRSRLFRPMTGMPTRGGAGDWIRSSSSRGGGGERAFHQPSSATSSVTVGWAIPSLRWPAVAVGGGITQVGGGGIAQVVGGWSWRRAGESGTSSPPVGGGINGQLFSGGRRGCSWVSASAGIRPRRPLAAGGGRAEGGEGDRYLLQTVFKFRGLYCKKNITLRSGQLFPDGGSI